MDFSLLTSNSYLDFYENEVVQLTWSLADIRNIDEKSDMYSQNIKIPATKHNQQILKFLNHTNSFDSYDTDTKIRISINAYDEAIIEGDIQVLDFVNEKGEEYYNCIITGVNNDLFLSTKNTYLNDLDFTDITHLYSLETVYKSWTGATGGTMASNYYYPYIERGDNWSMSEIKGVILGKGDERPLETGYTWYPAIKVKYLWDKIMEQYGYDYQSDFIENDVNFNNMFIPYTEDKRSITYDKGKKMLVSGKNYSYYDCFYQPNHGGGREVEYVWGGGNHKPYYTTGLTAISDPSDVWTVSGASSAATSIFFECPSEGTYSFSVYWYIFYGNAPGFPTTNLNTTIYFNYRHGMPGEEPNIINADNNSDYFQNSTLGSTGRTTFTIDLIENERVWVEHSLHPQSPIPTANGYQFIWDIGHEWTVVPKQAGLILGFTDIDFKYIVPRMYQHEFVKNIITMFNLNFEKIPFSNSYTFKLRDKYYEDGKSKDWTEKMDMSSSWKLSYFNDLDIKKYNFGYSTDSDYDNGAYEDVYKIPYGSTGITSTNEYATDEQNIEVTFSPTVCIQLEESQSPIIIPSMRSEYNSTYADQSAWNPRILYRSVINLNERDYYKFLNHDMTKFYTLHHFSDYKQLVENNEDLNFSTDHLMYTGSTTQKNLYNLYWMNYTIYLNSQEAEILEATFKINYHDFKDIRFNDRIYLQQFGSWWNINKINSYQVNTTELTKIELIKEKVGGLGSEIVSFTNLRAY